MRYKFSDYYSLGLNVIPLRGKTPLISWKPYQSKRADEGTISAWDNTQHNIGVVTGHVSEILVVDVDGEYPSDWPPMPKTWTVKTSPRAMLDLSAFVVCDCSLVISYGDQSITVNVFGGETKQAISSRILNEVKSLSGGTIDDFSPKDCKQKITLPCGSEYKELSIHGDAKGAILTEFFTGYHYYFYLSPDDNFKNSARIHENVDIRANGGYVVAPPSKHPEGGNYEWEEGCSPNDTQLVSIPDFVRSVLEERAKELYTPQEISKTSVAPLKTQNTDFHDDERKQAYIDAAVKSECDILRNTGQGGRNDQLNKSAFALAGLMSDDKVRAILEPIAREIGLCPIEIEKTIKSGCDSATPRDIPERAAMPPVEAGAVETAGDDLDDLPPLVRNILERRGKTVECSEISPHLIEKAPGLVGSVARWMTETARYPLPVVSLACAIPTVGTIMAHKVQTETGLRSNFFSLGIAESGSGKDHPAEVAQSLLYSLGMQDHVSGRPKSDTAVISSVKRASGQSLCLIDEMGRYLEGMVGRNAPAHTRNITSNMMGMYNSARKFFIGDEYADNEARGGRDDIDQPCYNLYGGTVAHRFYNSLSTEEAYDGFLSRWLVFETSRFDVHANNHFGNVRDVPDHIYDQCRYWIEQPKNIGNAADLSTYTQINPRVVYFSDQARKKWTDFSHHYRQEAANSNDLIDSAFYKRVGEHAAKLALVAHEGQDIGVHVMEWAITLAEALMKSNIKNIKANVSSSAYEAELQNVLRVVKRHGDLTKSTLTKLTQNIDRRKRQDIIDTLVEAGDIIEYKKDTGNKRPTTCYKIN